MYKKRIFIASADERLRIALLLRLEDVPGMAVIGFTDSLESLLPQLEASRPDVLLLEWQMTLEALTEFMVKIHGLPHFLNVIYFCCDQEDGRQMLAAGVDHVILKNAPPDELVPTLNKISIQTTKESTKD